MTRGTTLVAVNLPLGLLTDIQYIRPLSAQKKLQSVLGKTTVC